MGSITSTCIGKQHKRLVCLYADTEVRSSPVYARCVLFSQHTTALGMYILIDRCLSYPSLAVFLLRYASPVGVGGQDEEERSKTTKHQRRGKKNIKDGEVHQYCDDLRHIHA